jgi:hypothetical protein
LEQLNKNLNEKMKKEKGRENKNHYKYKHVNQQSAYGRGFNQDN